MIKTLIPVDTDLGSSIALRYIGELLPHLQMRLYDIHVVERTKVGSAPGSGWVQRTWENAIIDSATDKIRTFLEMENIKQPLLKNPQIIIGERSPSLLDELHQGQYDLFIEGCLPNVDPKIFYTLLNSRLYRLMPCPVLLVKNLVPFDKIALVLEKGASPALSFDWFFKDLKSSGIKLDVIRVNPLKAKTLTVNEVDPQTSNSDTLQKALETGSVTLNACKEIDGPAKKMAELFREYGLVMSVLRHKPRRNDHLIDLLGYIASPIVLDWL